MNGPSEEAVMQAMAFVLFMGAANADATPEQRAQMKQAVIGPLDIYMVNGDETAVREVVYNTLGRDWKPTGQWAAWIQTLQP